MKYLLLLAPLALLCSCVATTNDLADLSASLADTMDALATDVEDAAANGEDSSAAYEKALAEMGSAVGATIETITGRVESVAEKVGEGPLGWMEILGAGAALVAGGGVALNKHRNGTRATDSRVANRVGDPS